VAPWAAIAVALAAATEAASRPTRISVAARMEALAVARALAVDSTAALVVARTAALAAGMAAVGTAADIVDESRSESRLAR